jgi:hypothetical protein
MFPSTLDEIPNKWYKIEEACGHTLNWSDIKEIFIKDLEFIPEEEHLRETTQQIKIFLEKLTLAIQKEKGKMEVDKGSTSSCHLVSITQRIDMENTTCPGQIFRRKSNHPTMKNHVNSILKISTEEKEKIEQPEYYRHLEEAKPLEWMNVEVKTKEFNISNVDRPKMA